MATRNVVPRADGEGGVCRTDRHWGSGWMNELNTDAVMPIGNDNKIGTSNKKWAEGHFEKLVADDIIAKGPVVDVRAFGAKGDGVTDDTAAIQAAISVCIEQKKMLFIPSGAYTISSTIKLYGGIVICGENNGNTIIEMTTDAPLFEAYGTSRIDNVRLSDFTIKRTSATNTTPILNLEYISYSKIVNIDLYETITSTHTAVAVSLGQYSYYNHIQDVTVRYAYIGFGCTNESNGNTFVKANAVDCFKYGFILQNNSNSNSFYDCAYEYTHASGVTRADYAVHVETRSLYNLFNGMRIEGASNGYRFASNADVSLIPFGNMVIGGLIYLAAGGTDFTDGGTNLLLNVSKYYQEFDKYLNNKNSVDFECDTANAYVDVTTITLKKYDLIWIAQTWTNGRPTGIELLDSSDNVIEMSESTTQRVLCLSAFITGDGTYKIKAKKQATGYGTVLYRIIKVS